MAVALAVGGSSGKFPLGFVYRDYAEALLVQLGLLWIVAAATLAAVVAAVRIGGPRRVVGLRAARGVGVALIVLTILWAAFLGWLVMIGGGPVQALLLTLAATGPTLMLAAGIYAQGRIRLPWAALIPPAAVLILSGAATALGFFVGLPR